MQQYGRNFVVYVSTKGMTVGQLVKQYQSAVKGKRQANRIASDVQQLKRLNKSKKYKYTFRQYTGHRIQSEKISTPEGRKNKVFVSRVIWW